MISYNSGRFKADISPIVYGLPRAAGWEPYHLHETKMNFDEILDLTAVVFSW